MAINARDIFKRYFFNSKLEPLFMWEEDLVIKIKYYFFTLAYEKSDLDSSNAFTKVYRNTGHYETCKDLQTKFLDNVTIINNNKAYSFNGVDIWKKYIKILQNTNNIHIDERNNIHTVILNICRNNMQEEFRYYYEIMQEALYFLNEKLIPIASALSRGTEDSDREESLIEIADRCMEQYLIIVSLCLFNIMLLDEKIMNNHTYLFSQLAECVSDLDRAIPIEYRFN